MWPLSLTTTSALAYSYRQVCVGSFKSPDRTLRDYTNGLTSLSTDGVAKESLPKFNPRPCRGLNPGPPGWQSEILPTALTSHTTRGKISSSVFWREESCNKYCKLSYLNLCYSCFLHFAAKTFKNFHSFQNFHRLCNPSLLCCDWLFKLFLLCDWLFRTVRLQTQTVRLEAQNSAITDLKQCDYS